MDTTTEYAASAAGLAVPGLIRRVRRRAGMSQAELAEALSVGKSTVGRWETGAGEPTASVFEKLVRMGGYRLAVIDADVETVAGEAKPMRTDAVRTRGGSRYPAHFDVRASPEEENYRHPSRPHTTVVAERRPCAGCLADIEQREHDSREENVREHDSREEDSREGDSRAENSREEDSGEKRHAKERDGQDGFNAARARRQVTAIGHHCPSHDRTGRWRPPTGIGDDDDHPTRAVIDTECRLYQRRKWERGEELARRCRARAAARYGPGVHWGELCCCPLACEENGPCIPTCSCQCEEPLPYSRHHLTDT